MKSFAANLSTSASRILLLTENPAVSKQVSNEQYQHLFDIENKIVKIIITKAKHILS